MKKILFIITLLFVSLFAHNSLAYTAPAKPDNGWYVLDQTGKLSASQINDLNKKIDSFQKTSKNEIGILMVPSLSGESIEDVAQSVFRSWGIGKKDSNNGVLVVVALAERKSRIHTGMGMEGMLPDLTCNDILKNNLNPHLKRGDFYGGLSETIDVISNKLNPSVAPITPTKTPTSPALSATNPDAMYGLFIAVTFVVAISVFLWIFLSIENKRKKDEEKYRLQENLARQRRLENERQEILRRQREKENKLKEEHARILALAEKEQATLKAQQKVSRTNSFLAEEKSIAEKNSLRSVGSEPIIPTSKNVTPARVINVARVPATTVPLVGRSSPIKTVGTSSPIVHKTSIASNDAHLRAEREREESRKRDEEQSRRRERERKEEEERQRQKRAYEREEEYRRNREREEEAHRRQREEEDRRRREEDDRRSSYSSSSSSWSSWDSGSSGGGWGGGDSGGGGSSSDW